MVDLYIPSTISWRILDIPPLRDCDPCCPGIWIAASRSTRREIWSGAEIFISPDDTTFESLGPVNVESVMGLTMTQLGNVESCYRGYWDRINTVDVEVDGRGELFSVTEDAVLLGHNFAMVGQEIIGFRDVEQLDINQYRLSYLLRGRYDSIHFAGDHSTIEEFTLIDTARLTHVGRNLSEIGAQRYYKVVPNGGGIADFPSRQFTLAGNQLRPWAPTMILGDRNSGNDLRISWTPRTRARVRLLSPIRARSCCCEDELYEIDILDPLDATNILRTIKIDGMREAVYTAAQQTADGLTHGNDVDMIVFEVSKVVGRSFGRSVTL